MVYVNCEEKARQGFAALFRAPEDRQREKDDKVAAEKKRNREIRVARHKVTAKREEFKRRKGWLHRQVRSAQA